MKKIKAGVKKSLSLLIIIGLLLAYLPEGATFGKDTGVAGDPIPLALSKQEIKDPAAAPAKAPAKEGRPEEAATASDKKAGTKDRAALLRLQKALKEEADRTFDGDGDAYFSGLSLKAKSPKGPTGKVKIIQGDKGYFALDLKDLKLEKTDQIRLQLDPSIELVTSYYGQDKQAELTALLDRLDSDILSDSSETQEEVDKVKAIKPDYALEEEGLALDKESAEEGKDGLKTYVLSPEKADLESARLLFYAKAPVENPPVNLQIDQGGKTYALSLEDASSADNNRSQAADSDQDPADPAMSAEAERPAKEINPEKDLSDLITPTEGENSVLFRSSHEHDDYSYRYSVRKVWKDGNEKHYGESVTVNVYFSCYIKGKKGSGSIKDKYLTQITLSSRNGWQKELPNEEDIKENYVELVEKYIGYVKKIKGVSSLSYRLEEVPVEGYTPTISKTGEDFTITNTKTEPEPPPPPGPNPPPGPGPNPPPEPEGTQITDIKKMIDYLGDGAENPDTKVAGKEDYRQYLEFTGEKPKQTEEPGYDFLIAVDTTSSMTTNDYYSKITDRKEQRDVIANRLLNGGDDGSSSEAGLLTKLLKANPKNKACVMTFVGNKTYNGESYALDTQTDVPYKWQSLGEKSKADYVNVLYDEEKDGTGTNYCTPLYRAAQLFDSVANDKNKKVLIFITDGKPNESVSWYDGNNTVIISTSKYADITEDNSKAYSYLKSRVGDLDFHSIAIKIDRDKLGYLEDLTNTAKGKLHLANDAEALADAFKKITSNYSTNNLYLEDLLSPYVELNKEKIDFQIKRKADGKETVIWEGPVNKDYNPTYNFTTLGQPVNGGNQYIEWVSYSPPKAGDNATERVQVKFREDHNLGNEIFQVSYNLKINDTAKKYRAENPKDYPYEGEENTDFDKNNKTSSGKRGLRSNTWAKLTYMQAGKEASKDFPHPVVQTEPTPPDPPPPPDPGPEPTLDIHKQIKKEDLTDVYRLYLDVTGMQKKETVQGPGIDLVVVIDRSGSMGRYKDMLLNGHNVSRYEAVMNFLNGSTGTPGFIKKFLSQNKKNHLSLVEFGGDKYNNNPFRVDGDAKIIQEWTKDPGTQARITEPVNDGTHYDAGLLQAEELLKNRGTHGKNTPALLFISDGVPTYYTERDGRGYRRYGNGNYKDKRNVDTVKPKAMEFIKGFYQRHPGLTTYAVGVSKDINDTNIGSSYSPDVLQYMAKQAGGFGAFVGIENDMSKLNENLDKILTRSVQKVVIEDTLSDYVDLSDQPDFLVTKEGIETGSQTSVIWPEDEANPSGSEQCIESFEVDRAKKKLTLTFKPGYKMDGNCKYTFSYKVKVNQKAYDQLNKEGKMLHKGDPNTDRPGNHTSSGKAGFWSNQEAQISYAFGADSKVYTQFYPHPVVQPASPGLKIKKVDWEKPSQGLKGASFALYRTDPAYSWAEPIAAYSGTGSEKTTRFSTDGQGDLSIRGLEAGDYYLKEVGAPAGYRQLDRTLSFSLDEKGNVAIKGTPDPAFSLASGGIQVKNIKEGRELPQAGGPGRGSWAGLAILLVLTGAIRWRFCDGKIG